MAVWDGAWADGELMRDLLVGGAVIGGICILIPFLLLGLVLYMRYVFWILDIVVK